MEHFVSHLSENLFSLPSFLAPSHHCIFCFSLISSFIVFSFCACLSAPCPSPFPPSQKMLCKPIPLSLQEEKSKKKLFGKLSIILSASGAGKKCSVMLLIAGFSIRRSSTQRMILRGSHAPFRLFSVLLLLPPSLSSVLGLCPGRREGGRMWSNRGEEEEKKGDLLSHLSTRRFEYFRRGPNGVYSKKLPNDTRTDNKYFFLKKNQMTSLTYDSLLSN